MFDRLWAMSEKDQARPWKKGPWRVNRERCRLGDMHPPREGRGPSPISDVIPDVMRKFGLGERHWLNVLDEEWAGLVGEAVAKHTRPGRLVGRGLIVFVDNSVWLGELARYGKEQILVKLQQRFGRNKIREVRLQLDPDGAGGRHARG